MRRRTTIEAKPLFRLFEVSPDNVGEFRQVDDAIWIERVKVVHRDQPGGHIPSVFPAMLIGHANVLGRRVVFAKDEVVLFRILVSDGWIGKETQSLMIFYRERYPFGNVWLEQLRAPPSVIGFHERLPQVVQ